MNLNLKKMNFFTGLGFLFVLYGNKMIKDDGKSIVLRCFACKFVPYYDDTMILMFFKLMPHVWKTIDFA
jgi:hypothetical protein